MEPLCNNKYDRDEVLFVQRYKTNIPKKKRLSFRSLLTQACYYAHNRYIHIYTYVYFLWLYIVNFPRPVLCIAIDISNCRLSKALGLSIGPLDRYDWMRWAETKHGLLSFVLIRTGAICWETIGDGDESWNWLLSCSILQIYLHEENRQ